MRSLTLAAWLAMALPGMAGIPAPRVAEEANVGRQIRVTRFEYDQPRPLRAWAVRVDLADPDVEVVVTPRVKVQDGFEVAAATTLEFAGREHLQVAVNGGPFEPLRAKPGEPMKINGLHLSRGALISPANDRGDFGALLLNGAQQAEDPAIPAGRHRSG